MPTAPQSTDEQVKTPDSPGLRAGVYGRQSKGKSKSITDQVDLGYQLVEDKQWILVSTYDDGSSASRFRSKDREDWAQLCLDVAQGQLDVVVIWSTNRGSRDPEDWFPFLGQCRKRGVFIHVVSHHRTYDIRRSRDWHILADDGVDAAYDTEKLSEAVRRGVEANAIAGLPTGRVLYGYRRRYDPHTKKLVEQYIYPPEADIVRWIITGVAQRRPLSDTLKELRAKDVPAPGGGKWYRSSIRNIINNRAYIGIRVHKGKEYKATWPPIVTDEVWYASRAVLAEPGRKTTKPGRAKWLLSYIMVCSVCGGHMAGAPRTNTQRTPYRCADYGCVGTEASYADALIARWVVEWLSGPEARDLYRVDNDAASRLRGDIARWKQSVTDASDAVVSGTMSIKMAGDIEAGLLPKIEEAEKMLANLAKQQGAATVLDQAAFAEGRGRQAWDNLSMAAQRDVIKMILEHRGERIVVNKPTKRMSRWSTDEQRWAQVTEQIVLTPSTDELAPAAGSAA